MKRKSTRVLLLFLLVFFVRVVFSCHPLESEPEDFSFNSLEVHAVDNSGRYLREFDYVDTMYAEAVALKIDLSDTSFFGLAGIPTLNISSFSFPSLLATSKVLRFAPVAEVDDIQVITMMNLNQDIKAGADISVHVLCSFDSFDLYSPMNTGIKYLNEVREYPSASLVLVLKEKVENTKARFKVFVKLEDKRCLEYLTEEFIILPTPSI